MTHQWLLSRRRGDVLTHVAQPGPLNQPDGQSEEHRGPADTETDHRRQQPDDRLAGAKEKLEIGPYRSTGVGDQLKVVRDHVGAVVRPAASRLKLGCV